MPADPLINRYGSLAAEIYDIDKPVGARRDTAFLLERLEGIDGPVLEPACGSGRILLPLLEAGHRVTGFDLSEEMLARCQARCAAAGFTPDLSRQGFENFSYDFAFAAIVVPIASFTLIDDFSRAMAALRRFHDHLRPGGRLILDVQGLAALAPQPDDRRRWTASDGDLLTLEGVRVATDWLSQRVETLYRYERWRGHRLVEAQVEPMAHRYWGLEEARLALSSAGFTDIIVIGNYDASRPPRTSDRVLTYEARR